MMEFTSILFGNKEDVNANFVESEHYQSKSLIDFENTPEKEDSSRGKFFDFGGAVDSGESEAPANQLKCGTLQVDKSSKCNSSSGNVFYKAGEDLEIMLENKTEEEDQDQNTSIRHNLPLNQEIPMENKIGIGPWCDKDSSQDIHNDKSSVPMDGFVIHDKIQGTLSETNEFKDPFKAQEELDQLQNNVTRLQRKQKNRTVRYGENSTISSDVVVPINSATLYEELRRAIKEGNRLKKNNQQYELRNLELQGEVLEISRMAAHYEAKSERCCTREDELRNELNTAIKKATRHQKEADMCKKKIGLLEGLFVDSEKRQALVKKQLVEAENKIKLLEAQYQENIDKLKENNATPDGINDAVSHRDVASEVGHENEAQEKNQGNLREDEAEKPHASDPIGNSEYESKEYRYLISALKQQLNEANAISKRYGVQVMHHVITIEKLKADNIKLQGEVKEMKNNERGRKGKAFLYLQQYRESQVQMEGIQSELKNERAEKDDLKLQCKWMKIEVDRLKNALATKSFEEMQNYSKSNKDKIEGEDAKIIEDATILVEERMQLARNASKGLQTNGTQSQITEGGNVYRDANNVSTAPGDRSQYNTLKDQHEKLSIEMALTRNTVKKLESDNSELRQQVSLLKAEIALGLEAGQKEESGGVISGKYRRGNFEVVSKPTNGHNERQKSRRTQSMSGFGTITGSHGVGDFEPNDKAQSLIDLTKVSIDEIDERRSSLKKHSSEGEKIHETYEDKKVLGSGNKQFRQSLKTARAESDGETLLNEMAGESKSATSDSCRRSTMRLVHGHNSHKPLRPTISFPHTDELSSFGNFKKTENALGDYHVFKVPGALRASPAAKSLNSFTHPSISNQSTREQDQPSKQKRTKEQDYNYVAV